MEEPVAITCRYSAQHANIHYTCVKILEKHMRRIYMWRGFRVWSQPGWQVLPPTCDGINFKAPEMHHVFVQKGKNACVQRNCNKYYLSESREESLSSGGMRSYGQMAPLNTSFFWGYRLFFRIRDTVCRNLNEIYSLRVIVWKFMTRHVYLRYDEARNEVEP